MDFTQEQKDILKNIYHYKNDIELSEQEMQTVIEMFDTPDKFIILRKMLMIFSDEERGLVLPNDAIRISTLPENLETYGLQVAVNSLADEKIRQSLQNFFQKVQAFHKNKLETQFKKENEIKEEILLEKETDKKVVGDNI